MGVLSNCSLLTSETPGIDELTFICAKRFQLKRWVLYYQGLLFNAKNH